MITTSALQGRGGWNRKQGDDLAGVPVTLIAGDHYRLPGWPCGSLAQRLLSAATRSALARGIAGATLEVRECLVRPDVHTIGIAEQAGLPWTDAITWDPQVLDAVKQSVRAGDRPGDTADCSTVSRTTARGCATPPRRPRTTPTVALLAADQPRFGQRLQVVADLVGWTGPVVHSDRTHRPRPCF